MPERDGYIPGVPCWVDTSQPDPEAAVRFYSGLFEWEFEDMMPPGSEGKYFIARMRGRDVAAVGSIPEGAPQTAMWNTYIWVDNVDETASKVGEAGGRALMEPFDVTGAGRMAMFADPDGAAFCVWQAKNHKVNFNFLNTGDFEAAKRFYGTVFGWTTLDLGNGQFWTLSAYGDYLERLTPGTRSRTAEMGAAGFEDVVAAIRAIEGEAPAHWGVQFSTDDTDSTAAKAEGLSGEVVEPPVDVPWARITVIRDPQGATFTASQYAPENKDLR
jgi:predicted enzyme related to lactoylglutathione lyase